MAQRMCAIGAVARTVLDDRELERHLEQLGGTASLRHCRELCLAIRGVQLNLEISWHLPRDLGGVHHSRVGMPLLSDQQT